ncbi:4-aminobutyrate aminotransferase [Verticillium alfalfae VaMs.102]|uniref:4-aminobutyrate aminotransferase n=1 Tax=Verticillium alfalfae (strain VaMs.102 / ATCC MYA-4576 / FGSC 10136) TaxID=526221 RepID=C9SV12_VERA1|nr:4-aminobutyrate aminotransferase [Verticillium alfalfae VaMs.102]EEY22627.1 4-aminobutyrate aminotransferase [Verticillium alfalfae VaMs.102]
MAALRASSLLRPATRAARNPAVSRLPARAFSVSFARAASSLFPEEPARPTVKTEIPGPVSKKYIEDLHEVFDTRSLNMLTDYTKSIGKLHRRPRRQRPPRCLRQNRPPFPWATKNPAPHRRPPRPPDIGQRPSSTGPALGNFPLPRLGLDPALRHPQGRPPPASTRSSPPWLAPDANETAYKAAFMYRRQQERGGPNFNTWMGDPARALLFRAILSEVRAHDLVERTAQVGAHLFAGLERLAAKYPDQVANLRGKDRGTFIAFDSPRRDEVLKTAKTLGVNIGGSGASAVRLRPMLVFEESHADILLETLETIVSS